MKLFKIISIWIWIPIILTGCWDEKEIGEVNYATAIGIDYVDNHYQLYVQLLDFANVAKQEGNKQSETAALYIGRGSGSTFMEAVNNLYETSQQAINWGQIGAIIYSESVLEKGIEKVDQAIQRNGEFRYTPWMFGTSESIEKLLGVSGFFQLPPLYTILYKPKDTYKVYSYIKPLRMYKFNAIYKDTGGTSLLPSISVNRDAWKESTKEEIPKETLEVNGVFPINEGKYRQWMSHDEVIGIRWIEPKTNNTPVKIIHDEKDMGTIEIIKPKVRIKLNGEGNETTFIIEIKAKGQLTGWIEKMPATEIEQLVKQQIEKEIVTTFQKGIEKNVDIYNLKSKLFHHGMNAKGLKAYQLTADSLEVLIDFRLESKGIYD